ncbi:MAG: hypothetical protein H5U13_11500 [Parvibaculum sp.]|nr:hypothetical protein [Parvibaculum sp.]
MMVPSADFDWDGEDADSIVLSAQPATAIYRNARGCIVIRQRDPYDDDADSVLLVLPENAGALARAILAEAGDGGQLALPAPVVSNHSRTAAAERQRRYRERKRDGDVTRDGVTVTQRDSVTGGA